tara:strand:+ start:1392 stop:2048 length:657 start_codon:yes stop_codon:yes gene_type:complete
VILKIKFYSALVLFFFSFNGFSNKLKLGLHTGINFSTILASNSSDDFNYGKGFLPAVFHGIKMEYLIEDDFFLVSELNYSVKGYTNNQFGVRVRSYSNYITIPFRAKIISSENVSIELGSYLGFAFREYLINNITKNKVFGRIGNNLNNEPPDTLKPLDLGLQFGLNYNFNKIAIGAFLSYGLLNTRPGGGQGVSIRNLSTQLRVSYDIFNLNLNEKN